MEASTFSATVTQERQMRSTKRQRDAIRAYVEDQAHEEVVHLENAAADMAPLGTVRV